MYQSCRPVSFGELRALFPPPFGPWQAREPPGSLPAAVMIGFLSGTALGGLPGPGALDGVRVLLDLGDDFDRADHAALRRRERDAEGVGAPLRGGL